MDVTVVGAGALGASVAFHLTSSGANVTVLDPHGWGSQTTARAAGQCMHIHSSDALSLAGIRSIEMFHRFPDEVGRTLDFVTSGSVKVARSEEFKPQLVDEVDRARRLDVELDYISAADAAQLAPWFEAPEDSLLWFAPGDCYFEFPDSVPRAYLSAAVERGARYLRTRAIGVDHSGGVMTDDGVIGADVLVVAAGAWSRELLTQTTSRPPVWPVRHQIGITAPIASVRRAQPSVRVIEAKTYVRPHLGGLMIGGYETEPWSPQEPGSVADVADIPRSEEVLRSIIDRIALEFPSLAASRFAEVRAGLPTMSPDGHFVIDRLPVDSHSYVISGCNVAGFSTSPALGADLSDWIVTGERPAGLREFSLDRFAASYDDDSAMRNAARAMYADKYSYEELAEH